MTSYRTGDLAKLVGIHSNTVRLYEHVGLIAPAARTAAGYRVFGERHLYQLRVVRQVFGCEWVGRGTRRAALLVIRAMAEWDLNSARAHAQQYLSLLEREIGLANLTADILQRWAGRKPAAGPAQFSRGDAATLVGVTAEALRNWERNGLINVPRRGPNLTRCYGQPELERLRIIYMLRQAGYSLEAILRSLQRHDRGEVGTVAAALNQSVPDQELSWTGVGDRWLAALSQTADGAREILSLIAEACRMNL